jgi:hypothetical protein
LKCHGSVLSIQRNTFRSHTNLYTDVRLNDTLCERYQVHMGRYSRNVLKRHDKVISSMQDGCMGTYSSILTWHPVANAPASMQLRNLASSGSTCSLCFLRYAQGSKRDTGLHEGFLAGAQPVDPFPRVSTSMSISTREFACIELCSSTWNPRIK